MGRGGNSAEAILYGQLGIRERVLSDADSSSVISEVDASQLSLDFYFEEFQGFSGTERWGARTELLPRALWDEHMGQRQYSDGWPQRSTALFKTAKMIIEGADNFSGRTFPIDFLHFGATDVGLSEIAKCSGQNFCQVSKAQRQVVEALTEDKGQWCAMIFPLYSDGVRYAEQSAAIYADEQGKLLGWLVDRDEE